MKVFVFAYDRFDSMSTSTMLEAEGIDHVVLCHTQDAADRFVEEGTARRDRLVVTDQPRGLAYNRNVALDSMEHGEWALFLVDDLRSVTEVVGYDELRAVRQLTVGITMDNQSTKAHLFDGPCTMRRFVDEHAVEVAERCEKIGARLGGFAGIANPIYRDRKWKHNVLADGRAIVVRRSHLRFDEHAQLIDDLAWTADNIAEFGVMTINQWVLPDCRRYTAGGFGSIDQRMPQKLEEAAYLVRKHPGLIGFKKKAGWPDRSHVALRRRIDGRQRKQLEQVP